MKLVFRKSQNVGDGIDPEAHGARIDIDHDDDVAFLGFGHGEAEAHGQVDDRQDSAAQVDDAAHIMR